MKSRQSFKKQLIKLLRDSNDLEAAIALLREGGIDKGESIEILIEVGVPYKDAKVSVHKSGVWSDVRERDERLHQVIEDVVRREDPSS